MVFQRDLRVAVRRLLRNRAFAGINLTGLALATACSLLIFLYVQDELSFDRHHEHADRIVRVVDGNSAQTPIPLGPALTRDLPEVVSQVGLAPPTGVWILRSGDRVFYEHKVYLADPSPFDVFSIPLVLGNPETALQEPFSMVLSESMAAKYFGDENPLGRTLVADDGLANMVVTGVMPDFPPNSHFQADFFVPSSIREALSDWDFTGDWVGLAGREYTYLLLAANQSLAALEEKLPAVLEANLSSAARAAGITFDLRLQPLTDIHLHSHLEHELEANGNVSYVYLLTAIALFVLLIACFNFMNLSTARTAIRAREVGVRKVVGAERAQLIRMFLGESVVLAVTAVAIATTIVWFILPGFNQLSGKALSLASINPAVLILGLALLAGTVGMAAGSYPALVLSAFRPMAVLKGGLLASGGRGGLRRALVVVHSPFRSA